MLKVLSCIALCSFSLLHAVEKGQKNNPKSKSQKVLDIQGFKRSILDVDIEGLKSKAVYYASEKAGPKPLFVYLHGAGGLRRDITKDHSAITKGMGQFGYVCDVLLPHSKGMWQAKSLDALIDKVLSENEIDKSRIYVGGFSMGGAGTWVYGFEGKHDIAAFVPGGSGASKTAKVHDKWDLNLMKDKPIWMYHGDQDKVVPFANAAETAALMEKLNPQFKFIVLEGIAHSSGTTFKTKDFFEWLFRQKL